MRTSNIGRAALVAAGAVAVGAAFGSGLPATADTTSGDFSVAGGNQVHAPISVPVDASGNAVGAVGAAQGKSKGGAHVSNARHGGGGGGGLKTSGNFSVLGGNQVVIPISIPIDVCGNAVAIIGLAKAHCKGGASVTSGKKKHHHGWREASGYRTATGADDAARWGGGKGGGKGLQTSGNFSILGGNQVYAPISVPVNVCGNAVAVVGLAAAKCKGGASVQRRAGDPKLKTSGNFSVLGGNQVFAPISIPVNVCGNAVAVIGLALAQCKGGATVGEKPGEKPKHHHKPHKPHKPKPWKPSKHRPAAKHKKLPSNLRGGAAMEKGKAEMERGKSMLQRSKASLGSGDGRAATIVPSASNARPATNARMATTRTVTRPRSGEQLSGVQRFVNSLKRAVRLPGVNVKPGELGPKLPSKNAVPVELGTPVTR
ncbi:chaplin [Actinomadura decatromicini]|nr:chaplin [Actinomadura decatromicini]